MTHLPEITSTPAERLQALKDSKDLMSGAQPGGFSALFASSGSTPGHGNDAIDGFLRLADYITTGHDYLDTHPKGKRRPKIYQQHITVHAVGMSPEEAEKAEKLFHSDEFLSKFDDQFHDIDDDMGDSDPDGGSK